MEQVTVNPPRNMEQVAGNPRPNLKDLQLNLIGIEKNQKGSLH
tara:strand:+ start:4174 stop:4302 length:129 start_codon:yes stop_codon:yes gene_type:complete